jgi:hypothetical protein
MFKGYIEISDISNNQTASLIIKVETPYCSGPDKGIYLKLTNNKILIYDDFHVYCERIAPSKYLLKSMLPLTLELKEILSQYTIEQFGLAGRIKALSNETARELTHIIKNLD